MKPSRTNEVEFIKSRSGRVHVLALNDSKAVDYATFAEGLHALAMHKSATVCGRRMRVDWIGGIANPAATPAGVFADEQLCAACIRAMGDRSALVFERLDEDDRERTRMARAVNGHQPTAPDRSAT